MGVNEIVDEDRAGVTLTSLQEMVIDQAWAAVTSGNAGAGPTRPAPVELTGEPGQLPSRFAVEEVAVAGVSAALLAATALCRQRGTDVGAVRVDRGHVAGAVRSERYFAVKGRPAGASFAPLSRFWRSADGWVRTHANYPWHRKALVQAMGTSEDPGAVASALEKLSGEEIEDRVFAAGGIAAAVRTIATWHAHPQGEALAAEPLISHESTGNGAPRSRGPADRPLADVRVLDLTRVIAGPVCTRLLGALGAQVVRLDPPGRLDMAAGAAADTLVGKRSALLDLGTLEGAAVLQQLLSEADVVVAGYRPGSLDRFGLDEQSLAALHPGIVAVYLDAWGHSGPWSDRRGFDSVVQAPTGIAMGEARHGDEPGVLPCQILDHGTGYLAAAAALDGLRRQWAEGGTVIRRLSLARTALWLTSQGTRPGDDAAVPATEPDPPPWLVELESAHGAVTAVAPPGVLGDRPCGGRALSPVTAPTPPGGRPDRRLVLTHLNTRLPEPG
ncbi:MAG: CoA transferase [Acidimicrobiales bacterium]